MANTRLAVSTLSRGHEAPFDLRSAPGVLGSAAVIAEQQPAYQAEFRILSTTRDQHQQRTKLLLQIRCAFQTRLRLVARLPHALAGRTTRRNANPETQAESGRPDF